MFLSSMSEIGRKLVADNDREMTRLAEMWKAQRGAHGVHMRAFATAIRVV